MSDEQNFNMNDVSGNNVNIGGTQNIYYGSHPGSASGDGDGLPRVFISYSRADGEDFATDLRKRLEAEGLPLWQDRARMEGGVGWWKQITDALDAVEFMVLVATPAAIASAVVKKEWRYARQQGVCVYPVQVPGLPLDFAAMPKWMRDSHFYNLDHEWETFVNYLKAPCTVAKVPFMAPDLPEHFVQRPEKFDPLKAQLLDADYDNPVAITTALKGAGGFGKTTLAAALCHDEDIQTAFDEGVLWVTLGENPNIINKLTVLYRALTDENPGFIEIEEGANKLAEKLVDADVLLVIDDVWNPAHLRPFLRGGERTARLVTTRFSNIAVDANADLLEVDEMTADESVQMLLAGIEPPDDLTPFKALAERLGEWALMLEVTNGTLRKRMAKGADLDGALAYVNKALDKRGVAGLKTGSNEAAVQVLDTSIAQVDEAEQTRLFELSIFAEDTDVPLTSVMALWDMDDFDTEELIDQFDDLSFVRFDAEEQTIRLHDVVREVLASRLDDPAAVHGRLIENYGSPMQLTDKYSWLHYAYHLHGCNKENSLYRLLLNYEWVMSKLKNTHPNSLIDDYDFVDSDPAIGLIRSTISMSSHILHEKYAVAHQIYGRLMAYRGQYPEVAQLLREIEISDDLMLTPQSESFRQAGGSLTRTLPVGIAIRSIDVTADGKQVVVGLVDGTIQVWNWKRAKQIGKINAHEGAINALQVHGDKAITASDDGTIGIFSLATQKEIFRSEQHKSYIIDLKVENHYMVSASMLDGDVRVWNWKRGTIENRLTKSFGAVRAVAIQDSRVFIAVSNKVKLWNWQTNQIEPEITVGGKLIRSLSVVEGHLLCGMTDGHVHVYHIDTQKFIGSYARDNKDKAEIFDVTISQGHLFYCSEDRTVRIWNWGTKEFSRTLRGHAKRVSSLAVRENMVFSGSEDGSVFVWDWTTQEAKNNNKRHKYATTAICFSNGKAYTASLDETVNTWDLSDLEAQQLSKRHKDGIWALDMLGDLIFSCSLDGVIFVQNCDTGDEISSIRLGRETWAIKAVDHKTIYVGDGRGELHEIQWTDGRRVWSRREHARAISSVESVGNMVITTSLDHTARIWDKHQRQPLYIFHEHTKGITDLKISGDIAFTASDDCTIRLWNWKKNTPIHTLEGHKNSVACVTLFQHIVVSGSEDHSIKIWDWRTNTCHLTLELDAPITSLAISERFASLLVGDLEGNVHFLRPNRALRRLMGLEEDQAGDAP